MTIAVRTTKPRPAFQHNGTSLPNPEYNLHTLLASAKNAININTDPLAIAPGPHYSKTNSSKNQAVALRLDIDHAIRPIELILPLPLPSHSDQDPPTTVSLQIPWRAPPTFREPSAPCYDLALSLAQTLARSGLRVSINGRSHTPPPTPPPEAIHWLNPEYDPQPPTRTTIDGITYDVAGVSNARHAPHPDFPQRARPVLRAYHIEDTADFPAATNPREPHLIPGWWTPRITRAGAVALRAAITRRNQQRHHDLFPTHAQPRLVLPELPTDHVFEPGDAHPPTWSRRPSPNWPASPAPCTTTRRHTPRSPTTGASA